MKLSDSKIGYIQATKELYEFYEIFISSNERKDRNSFIHFLSDKSQRTAGPENARDLISLYKMLHIDNDLTPLQRTSWIKEFKEFKQDDDKFILPIYNQEIIIRYKNLLSKEQKITSSSLRSALTLSRNNLSSSSSSSPLESKPKRQRRTKNQLNKNLTLEDNEEDDYEFEEDEDDQNSNSQNDIKRKKLIQEDEDTNSQTIRQEMNISEQTLQSIQQDFNLDIQCPIQNYYQQEEVQIIQQEQNIIHQQQEQNNIHLEFSKQIENEKEEYKIKLRNRLLDYCSLFCIPYSKIKEGEKYALLICMDSQECIKKTEEISKLLYKKSEKGKGFEITTLINPSEEELVSSILLFTENLSKDHNNTGLLYFSTNITCRWLNQCNFILL